MNEELKKEPCKICGIPIIEHIDQCWDEVLQQITDRAYQEGQKEKLFVLYTDEMKKNREEATLAERKRCAEIARKWVDEYMDGTVENRDLDRLATAIEKGEEV